MPSEKGAISMETVKGKVSQNDEKYFIEIPLSGTVVKIPLSDDKPSEVKNAFNVFLVRLREGPFKIQLDGVADDLFSQVANEYISQLNREMAEIRREMDEHGLVPSTGTKSPQ